MPGLGTTRSGRPVISLQTMINRVTRRKHASAVEPAKGVLRFGQLLTGGHRRALEKAREGHHAAIEGFKKKYGPEFSDHAFGPASAHAAIYNLGKAIDVEKKTVRNTRVGTAVGAAAGAGLGYGVHRHHSKRKQASDEPEDLEDVEQAATVLRRSRSRGARLRDYTAAGTVGKPIISVLGSMTEHGIKGMQGIKGSYGGKGARLAGLGKGLAHGFHNAATLSKLPRQAVEGGIGGGLLAATRDQLEANRARRTAQKFLDESDKTASKPWLRQKLAQGLQHSVMRLSQKIQPVPTSKLRPIVDDDYDFEV